MAQATRSIHQNFLDEDIDPISVLTVHEGKLTQVHLQPFIDDSPQPIGIAPAYAESDSRLVVLAIANQTNVLLVEFYSSKPNRDGRGKSASSIRTRDNTGRTLLQNEIFCRPFGDIFAFDFEPIALSLYKDHGGLRLVNGVDIQSACLPKNRQPLASIKLAVGDSATIYEDNVRDSFDNMVYDPKRTTAIALRAWIAQYIPRLGAMEEIFANAKRIDTAKLPNVTLDYLAKTSRDKQHLDEEKPTHMTRKVDMIWNPTKGQVIAHADRYQNKMRESKHQRVHITVGDTAARGYVLAGHVAEASGKTADIAFHGPEGKYLGGKVIGTLTTTGREAPTNAERQRGEMVLQVLQGDSQLIDDNPWLQKICFPSDDFSWPPSFSAKPTSSYLEPDFSTLERPLNNSQCNAVKHMLDLTDDSRINLIHGPPGTGKTTVIATYVHFAILRGQRGIWLTAQSNVAVKNIAEKLSDSGFTNWRLLVSKDFHHEWHEHLYSKIEHNLIRSDDFSRKGLHKRLDGVQVILCTLSILSNPQLVSISRLNPVTTLIVDEASQIEIGDYMAVVTKYSSLRKMCFIGDDKQLPPHGQEQIANLQSIFEVAHLRDTAVFLDIQYRMPPQIGDFISTAVYNGQLLSNQQHPVTDKIIACHLIDVSHGKQQIHETSFKNLAELEVTLQIAEQLQIQGKNFRIITPYDAQRSALEEGMKEHGLDWEDKCFNVDSFQGNEDDYIIISTVRSYDLGFLNNLRRTNVMLTRCKRGMFICSSRAYLEGDGAQSLVGELAAEFGQKGWVDMKDLKQVLLQL